MWPWGHLAFGYLLYTTWIHLVHRRSPTGLEALALAFGTQFPDLVDKPLAWTFGVLPSGRSLTHSLLVAVIVIAGVFVLLRRRGVDEYAVAFGIGYFSHLVGDSLKHLLSGEFEMLAFLLYPITYTDYGVEQGFLYHLSELRLTQFLGPETLVILLVVAIWVRDGTPGPGALVQLLGWTYRRLTRT
ncbi:metal-dependent hydrolase [Haloprofundus salilacus]|uniref:metal-dependent hydrolase n=1 Tax=Haloprofundus salilacus TaxID=2876190 RepID=UPI001CCF8E3A|nr:metal-dependent hydrolase [Haloprofundus salilacus]